MAVQASWSVPPGAQVVEVLTQAIPTRTEPVASPVQSTGGVPGPPSWQVNWSTGRVQSLFGSFVPSARRV